MPDKQYYFDRIADCKDNDSEAMDVYIVMAKRDDDIDLPDFQLICRAAQDRGWPDGLDNTELIANNLKDAIEYLRNKK